MEPFIYLVLGFVLGIEANKRMAQKPFSWKHALVTGLIAFLIAVAVMAFIDQLPCFLGVPNCD